jgi:hypothetical protein
MRVLDVDVSPDLLARWVTWLAPERQPFFLTAPQVAQWGLTAGEAPTDPQIRDTFKLWGVQPGLDVVWLDQREFAALPRPVRAGLVRAQVAHDRGNVPSVRAWAHLFANVVREQAGGRRFVWWPSLVRPHAADVLPHLVADGVPSSRHAAVPAATWARASAMLPQARVLAGTFPDGSGANCFGTVMGAAGVPDAVDTWMQREPFEAWLTSATRPGGDNNAVGTVFVWRSTDSGLAQHAAVTLGDGWVLNKRSQSWDAPRVVLSVRDAVISSRTPGLRLSRHQLVL